MDFKGGVFTIKVWAKEAFHRQMLLFKIWSKEKSTKMISRRFRRE